MAPFKKERKEKGDLYILCYIAQAIESCREGEKKKKKSQHQMFSSLFFYFKWATYLNQLSAQNEQADLISLGPWWVNEWKGGVG